MFQNYLTFNPASNRELVSNSKTQAVYYSWVSGARCVSCGWKRRLVPEYRCPID